MYLKDLKVFDFFKLMDELNKRVPGIKKRIQNNYGEGVRNNSAFLLPLEFDLDDEDTLEYADPDLIMIKIALDISDYEVLAWVSW